MNKHIVNFIKPIAIIVFVSLVILLLVLEKSTAIVWTMVIPVVPVLFLIIGYSNWRNVCPLAFFSQLSQKLNWIQKRKVPQWFEKNFYFFQYFILFIAFNARLTILNFDNLYLALFFVLVIILAFTINLVYTGKSWCNFFCPVGAVERIYCGSNAHNYNTNSACSKCSACKKNCPDIDMESNYWKESINKQKTFVFYSFSGLVLGFYMYFYLQTGSFEHYFIGSWANEDVSMLSAGFFFAPFIPVVIAAPLTLASFAMASYYIFIYSEKILWKLYGGTNITYTTLLHRVKVIAAFTAFNIFYIFAGAPAYSAYPLTYGLFHFLVITISAIILHKEFFREESFFIQERFAIKMIKRWKSDKPIPTNLKEIYYTYSNEKKNKDEQLQMYKESLSDLLQEGILTEGSMVILEKLREQMGISQKDHLDIIRDIKINNEELFDANVEKSAERRYQKSNYKKMIEDVLNEHLEINHEFLNTLQKQFHISNEDHKEIMEDILHSNTRLIGDVIDIIEEMTHLATLNKTYYNDKSIETDFLRFTIRNKFNIISKDLFTILNVIYEDHKEELKPLRDVLKYDREELDVQCNNELFDFMDHTIITAMINLKTSLDLAVNTDEESNVKLLNDIFNGKDMQIATVALLSLNKHDASLYSDMDFDKFLSSGDMEIISVAKKISTASDSITSYDKMMYLHSTPFFKNITFNELNYLAHVTELVTFESKDMIIKQGDSGDSLFMITKGEVEVLVDDNVVATLTEGSYFGEIAIVADVKRTASVVACSEVTALRLLTNDFKNFICENPTVSISLMKEITLRLLQNKN